MTYPWAIAGLSTVALVVAVVFMRSSPSLARFTPFLHDDQSPLGRDQVGITFYGVSTLIIEDNATRLIIDAFVSRPRLGAYVFGASTDDAAVEAFVSQLRPAKATAIFVTHSHIDHALDVAAIAMALDAPVYGSASTLNIAEGGGVPSSQLYELAPDKGVRVGAFSITAVESVHSPESWLLRMGVPSIAEPLEQPANHWRFAAGLVFDFVIRYRDICMVIKGSANYNIGDYDGIKANLLLLGTARLGKQGKDFQSRYIEETIGKLGPDIVVPLHWDDFLKSWHPGAARLNSRFIDSTATEGVQLIRDAAHRSGAEFLILQAGSRLVLD